MNLIESQFYLSKKIKIAILDNQQSFCDGFHFALKNYPEFNLLHCGINKDIEINCLKQVDVLIFNFSLSKLQGPLYINELKSNNSNLKVIALGNYDRDINEQTLYQLGYYGAFSKIKPLKELFDLITFVQLKSQKVFPKVFQDAGYTKADKRRLIFEFDGQTFSAQELKIIKLTCEEKDNSEIAERLFISKRTVEGYKSKLMEKINSKHPASIVNLGYKMRLITLL